jgi:hypothetical protein
VSGSLFHHRSKKDDAISSERYGGRNLLECARIEETLALWKRQPLVRESYTLVLVADLALTTQQATRRQQTFDADGTSCMNTRRGNPNFCAQTKSETVAKPS